MDLPVPCLLAQCYPRRLLLELVLFSSSRRYLTVLDPLGGTDVQSEITLSTAVSSVSHFRAERQTLVAPSPT